MLKRLQISLLLLLSATILDGQTGVPVMLPIAGQSLVCSAPGSPQTYVASATNSPTNFFWSVVPSSGVIISNPNSATTTISFPASNTTYTINSAASNGFGPASPTTMVVNVFVTPQVTFSGGGTFCQGSSTNIQASPTSISASSTISYSWIPSAGLSATNISSPIATPSVSTNYTVNYAIGTCTNVGFLNILLVSPPTVTASSSSPTVCLGGSVTLTGAGANTYNWSGGVINGQAFSPAFTTTYFLSGSSGSPGCTSTNVAAVTITVFPLPLVSASGNDTIICAGQSIILSGNGATNYNWTGGAINGVPFIPPGTSTYSVTGTNTLTGCTSTNLAKVSVTVNPAPIINTSLSNTIICSNQMATLTISGNALTYSLNNTVTNNQVLISGTLSPGAYTYTISASNSFNCYNSATVSFTTSNCTGIDENGSGDNRGPGLYPNPNNGNFYISSTSLGTFFINDNLGRLVMKLNLEPGTSQFVTGLEPGIYYITQNQHRTKFIVTE